MPPAVVIKSRRSRYLPLHRRYQAITCKDAQELTKCKRYIRRISKALGYPITDRTKTTLRKLLRAQVSKSIKVRICRDLPPRLRERKNYRFHSFEEWELPHLFRFRTHDDLRRLKRCLNIADVVTLSNKSKINGEEYLLLGLFRLAAPQRLFDAERFFGMDYTLCSRAFDHFIVTLDKEWGWLLGDDNLAFWKPYFPECAAAISLPRATRVVIHSGWSSLSNLEVS